MKIRAVLDGTLEKTTTPSSLVIDLKPDAPAGKVVVVLDNKVAVVVDRRELFAAATAVCGTIVPDQVVSVG